MTAILVVGEDELCCALGERLVAELLPGWRPAAASINTKGVTRLQASLPRYLDFARNRHPVLCIADTDRAPCVAELLQQWLPHGPQPRFLLRLAVTETESWLLADRDRFAAFLQIADKHVPAAPDELMDAKGCLLALARRSKVRHLRQELLADGPDLRQGSGYNVHLGAFVRKHWQPRQAAAASPSLRRAVTRIAALGGAHE